MDNTVEENMEKIVAWLMNIERLAGDVYKQAAHYFQDDPTLRQFLEHIADDEAEHFRIMEEALKYVKTHPIPMQPVTIDDETNTKIGRIFDEVLQKITAQTLTKDQVYKDIVAIERSKFNDIFLCKRTNKLRALDAQPGSVFAQFCKIKPYRINPQFFNVNVKNFPRRKIKIHFSS